MNSSKFKKDMKPKMMAEGGMSDDDMLTDHMAMEAVHAVHNKDHAMFKSALHGLLAHYMSKEEVNEHEEADKEMD